MLHTPSLSLSTALLLTTTVTSQALVKDINPTFTNPSGVFSNGEMFTANGLLFFPSRNAPNSLGIELSITDGTPAGTQLIWTIAGSAKPSDFADLGNGRIVFRGRPFTNGYEPYVTDGTAAGTFLIADLLPGTGSGLGRILGTLDDRALLAARDDQSGYDLWVTDGTAAGTAYLADLSFPALGASYDLGVEFQDRFYFAADDGIHGEELWVTDGTVAGTERLTDLNPGGGSNIRHFQVFGNKLLFSGYDPVTGNELYATDGTASGTALVADAVPGPASLEARELTVIGSTCYGFGQDVIGVPLVWTTDGNTVSIVTSLSYTSAPGSASAVNGILLFNAWDATHGRELWRSDGTAAGTYMAADITPGSASTQFGFADTRLSTGSHLIFSANTGGLGFEPYVSDGTAAGTQLLRRHPPGCQRVVDTRRPHAARRPRLF